MRRCAECGRVVKASEHLGGLCQACSEALAGARERLADFLGHPVFCAECGAILEGPADLCKDCVARRGPRG